jgi:hypothetical protein
MKETTPTLAALASPGGEACRFLGNGPSELTTPTLAALASPGGEACRFLGNRPSELT